MLDIIILISFIILTTLTFYINNYIFLSIMFLLCIILFIIFKVPLFKIIKYNFYAFISFNLIIFLINLLFMNFKEAFLILIKLFIINNLGYAIYTYFPSHKLVNTFQKVLKPLELLNIDTNSISLIITIGITFIPILFREINRIQESLFVKGIKKHSITCILYTFKILIPNLFNRINNISYSLLAKGFN